MLDIWDRKSPIAGSSWVLGLGRPSQIRGSPSCMGKGRLPTNAMRGSPSCKGQGSLAHEGTLRARVTFPHIDPIFSDPRLPPRSSPGKLTFRSMGTGQVAIFCFMARHGLKRITLAPTVNTPGRPRQLQSSPVHSRTEPRINPTEPGSKLSNRRMETPAR